MPALFRSDLCKFVVIVVQLDHEGIHDEASPAGPRLRRRIPPPDGSHLNMSVHVYYRTNEAIQENPVCFTPNEDGLLKEDYELVHEFTTAEAPSLEGIFRTMNAVDGDELCCQLKVRSMMPGDVVVDEDGDVWFCGGAGWEETNWW